MTYRNAFLFLVLFLFMACHDARKNEKMESKNANEKYELITLHTGETFTIKLNENASIGSSHCWINEGKCHSVKEDHSWYVSSPEEKKGCMGCGGTGYWKFKAVTQGTDTIKIKYCPTGRKQKNCGAFQEDSLAYKEDLKFAPRKYDKAIIVHVVR